MGALAPPDKSHTSTKPQSFESVLVDGAADQMKLWERTGEKNGWRFVGECPRCHHRMDKFFPNPVLVMKLMADSTSSPPKTDASVVRCNCGKEHPGRDASERGCGAYWGIVVKHEDAADAAADRGNRS
jgi:hypothetical protein